MTAGVSCRPVEAAELEMLLRLYRHLHPGDDPPTHDSAMRIWREFRSNPCLRCLGAFVGGDLLASCTLAIVPNLTRGGRPYGVVENVVTHEDHRRRGLGRCVLEEALASAWAADCYKVVLPSGRRDAGIVAFYASAGFVGGRRQAFVARPVT